MTETNQTIVALACSRNWVIKGATFCPSPTLQRGFYVQNYGQHKLALLIAINNAIKCVIAQSAALASTIHGQGVVAKSKAFLESQATGGVAWLQTVPFTPTTIYRI